MGVVVMLADLGADLRAEAARNEFAVTAFWVFCGCVVLVLLYLVIHSATRHSAPAGRRYEGVALFPPVPLMQIADGPGRYRVSGVDRESKMDTSMVVTADSAGNAKVKAELEGVIVTNVERQP